MKSILPHITKNSANLSTVNVRLSINDLKRILLATELFALQYSGAKIANALKDQDIVSKLEYHEIDCEMLSRFPDTYIKELFEKIDDHLMDAMSINESIEVH